MKTKVKLLFSIATMLMLLVRITGVALADVHTDLQVYSAGDTVSITGDGMNGGESVGIDVAFPDGSLAQHQDVMADDAGNFADSYVLPSDAPGGIYTVIATGADSGNSFSTTFDPPVKPHLACVPALPEYNNTHYGIMLGQTVTCTITDAVFDDSPTTLDVFIQSSTLGNETVTGTVSGTTITFTYTGRSNGCDTTDVKYDDGSGHSKDVDMGFAFVDANGHLLACGGTTPKDLTVTKTADASYTRTYGWTIEKSAKAATIVPYLATGYKYQIVNHGVGQGFEQPSFDDSTFDIGDAGFGTAGNGCGLNETDVKTTWPLDTDILVRKEFVLPTGVTGMKVSIGVAIDNDVQVFINGVDVSGGMQQHEGCANQDSFVFTVPDGVLHGGINLIAVRGVDRGVLSYLDLQMTSDNIVYSAGGGESGAVNYTVEVTKGAAQDSDFAVSGIITVSNPNSSAVSVTGVSDLLAGASVNCGVTFPYSLAGGGTLPCTYSASVADNSSGTNTATATWDSKSASGSADYSFGDPTNVVNDCVDVTDTFGGSLGNVCASHTFNYSHTFTGDPAGTCTSHENTATITQTGASASATVTDCQGADLTVSKTANPAFKRTYTWGITKSVDKNLVEQLSGSVVFNYTVKVTHDSGIDSNWVVNGTIAVSNPNNWEAITADLTDAVNNGGICVVTNGTGISVPASGSVSRDYTCTYASAPSPTDGTNTVTAAWDKVVASTPNSSATGTATVMFSTTSPTLIDNCATVTDTLGGSLGTVCSTDPSPKAFTYSKTVAVPTNDKCTVVNNTATFETNTTHSKGLASQTVTVCGAVNGGLTIGFWQNKNGQSIITGGASTAGVCNSGTWLRQYAPFQDLSATATCAQVGTYVTNIIKAANASGASMNAMLKAQMLATSLDVYFSDLALGGNKINAPTPLGGVKVDLTKICKMIDGSGGTATCGGTYQNASSAFGGATSLTVSQILAYAASQSNVGGGAWYGQVKATQELAKNTFDAINNQVALVAP